MRRGTREKKRGEWHRKRGVERRRERETEREMGGRGERGKREGESYRKRTAKC